MFPEAGNGRETKKPINVSWNQSKGLGLYSKTARWRSVEKDGIFSIHGRAILLKSIRSEYKLEKAVMLFRP